MNNDGGVVWSLALELRRIAGDPVRLAEFRRSFLAMVNSPNGDFRSAVLQFAAMLENGYYINDGQTETNTQRK